jgi:hypothetical protein
LQTHVVGQSDDVKNGAAAAALDLQLIVTIEARIKTIEFVCYTIIFFLGLFFWFEKKVAPYVGESMREVEIGLHLL